MQRDPRRGRRHRRHRRRPRRHRVAPWASRSSASTRSPTSRSRGNPAAVCLLDAPARRGLDAVGRGRDEPLGDRVRRTASPATGSGCGGSRRRSRSTLCGHATLATAHVLSGAGRRRTDARCSVRRPGSGVLRRDARRRADRARLPAAAVAVDRARAGLLAALGGVEPRRPRVGDLPPGRSSSRDATAVRALAPDFAAPRRARRRSSCVTEPRRRPRRTTSCPATSAPRTASTRTR